MKEHHLFIVPGLGDKTTFLEWSVRDYQVKYGITPHVRSFGFMNPNATYEDQFLSFVNETRKYIESPEIITSFAGTSAGGSVVLNAMVYLAQEGIELNGGMVNICGRLRTGKKEQVKPSLESAARKSSIFYESVIQAEEGINMLTNLQRSKILTFRGVYDEVVPVSTIPVEGATNARIPMIGHLSSIASVLLFYGSRINDFIRKLE